MAFDDLLPQDDTLNSIHLVYFSLGLFNVLLTFVSLFLKDRLFLTEAFFATVFGVVLGPVGAKLFDSASSVGTSMTPITVDVVILEVSRVILGIQCLATGVQSPGNFIWNQRGSMLFLLGPVMLGMWLMSTLIIYLVMGLSPYNSFLIAACVTPTDPVLAKFVHQPSFVVVGNEARVTVTSGSIHWNIEESKNRIEIFRTQKQLLPFH